MYHVFPDKIETTVKLAKLLKVTDKEKRSLSERLSSRMVKCASVLPEGEYLGWQMTVPVKGMVNMIAFGTKDIRRSDLEWIAEKTAKTAKCKNPGRKDTSPTELYELYLPIAESRSINKAIGFGADAEPGEKGFSKWPPYYYSAEFGELIKVLRETGGIVRAVVGSASEEEQDACRKDTLKTYDVGNIHVNDYIGRPVRMRVLFLLPGAPSVRLRTVMEEAVQGAKFRYVGNLDQEDVSIVWNNPAINAAVLPDYAARIMMLEPIIEEPTIGIEICEEEMKKIPASHKNTKDDKAVVIGKATDTTGIQRKMSIGEVDLKRHYQIVGQTGTGKSTLLATLILSAIEQGYGLTFFDPHGSTIDTVLNAIPGEYADRVRVVRIGDTENPVPLNIWDSDDLQKEERNINDLAELFSDIFDPKKEGFLGPRWERWFATFAKASIALLGRRASLESIAVISQSQDNMLKASKVICKDYPGLFETIKNEYGLDKGSDFHSTLNWYLCKFQRLTSVEALRKTLGAGTNALDFAHTIDTNTVTLVDLAAPMIGAHASRIIGTLIMMKLWNAVMARKERERTHLVVVDEASLFQTNPMPRMLAESRKFGISMVLCHQHTGQLTEEIRDALEANSANLSAFRLSTKDAAQAAIRFDDPEMQTLLARLDAFHAITTLSVDGRQTAPFTLETILPKNQKNDEIASIIEEQSRETLVEPYRKLSALSAAEIQDLLNEPEKITDLKPRWIRTWEKKRAELKNAG